MLELLVVVVLLLVLLVLVLRKLCRGQRGMVVVMEGVVSGGPHRDAFFVNGILGWTHSRKVGGSSDESRSQQAKEGLAVKRELGAAGGTPSNSRKFKNSRREIESAVKAGWHRQMAEGTKERLKWARQMGVGVVAGETLSR